ncbi:O-antigen ligase family protein [Dyella sp. M7H15-1]|uniref:O-antigen ligase family protein n=1 Tax=Dyella sp. M7H15-1 TaxID=2501295 RepID=UPI0010051AB1|nr:O-antigen ligase family protein [Dyella sp. M7H15-1]QAU24706.1 O-antigen ligase family protein [Dyella sp. M7H15-1]
MDTPKSESLRLRQAILLAGQWCAVASLFVVPINKPATNVAVFLSILFSLLGSDTRQRWLAAWHSPVARGVLAWWGVLLLSVLHAWYATGRFPATGMGTALWAYLYPLAFASLLYTSTWRKRAIGAFVAAMTLVLLISYGMDAGLLPQRAVVHTSPDMRNTVFKEYTQQGLDTLVLGCIALALAITSTVKRTRVVFVIIAVAALANVALVIQSRTAYITLIPVLLYGGYRLLSLSGWNKKQIVLTGAAMAMAGLIIWKASPIQDRLVNAIPSEVAQYEQSHQATSTGIRLELWQHTLSIIKTAPWFGHGYGQWIPLYEQSIGHQPNANQFMEGHPHQEMLLIASEEGVLGLAFYLFLLAALLRYALRLALPERDIYLCLLLIYLVAGLGNCLWADFSHRHLFILLLACIPAMQSKPQASSKSTVSPELTA